MCACVFTCFSIVVIASPSLSPLRSAWTQPQKPALASKSEATQEEDSVLPESQGKKIQSLSGPESTHPPNRGCTHSVHLWEEKGSWNRIAWVPLLSLLAKHLASRRTPASVSRTSPRRDPLALLGSHLESKLEAVRVRVVALPLGSLQTPIGSALAAWCAGSGTTPKWERKKTMVRQHWWT